MCVCRFNKHMNVLWIDGSSVQQETVKVIVLKPIVVTDFLNHVKGWAFRRVETVTVHILSKLFLLKRMGEP